MAQEWETLALAEAPLEIIDGDRGVNYPKQDDFAASGHCLFLNTGNVTTTGFNFSDCSFITQEKDAALRKGKLHRRDVVLTTRGTVGNVAFFDDSIPFDNVRINSGMVLLRADQSKLWPQFLYQFVRSPNFCGQVAALSTGSAQPQLPIRDIRRVVIPLPTLAEQKAIAAVLGALDDKIELNRRMNATLDAIARALFQSWFGDFDPVRAKLDGRQPAGLDPATAALFPNEFEDSELGPIPKDWEVRTIEQLAERVAMGPFGSDIKVSTFVPKGIPVVSGQHLRGILLDDSEFNFVTVEHADRLKRSNVQRGDVIFTHAGSVGQVAYIPETSRYQRYIISQRQFYMRCNHSVISPFYIASYFKTPEGQHRLLANTSSTGVPSISQPVTYLRRLQMVVPPPALLKIFDATVSGIHLKMADNDQQTRTLTTLRDTLLPKLLGGRFDLSNITRKSIS
jgi:type I restriction enzyme S subunit